jgi:enoyl-CoA hydratase/carnithine racemase
MRQYANLDVSLDPRGVLTVRLNRPDADNALDAQFLGVFKKMVGSLHKHSLRRGIKRHSRPRVETVRHLPEFIYCSHASF